MTVIGDWSNLVSGRAALVTGAGAGVGRAIACEMARAGATVWVNDVSGERADEVAAEMVADGLAARAVACDVGDLESVRAMRERTGPVDILVNNAGTGIRAFADGTLRLVPFVETDPAEWGPIMRVNVDGVLHMTHTYLPDMLERKWGRVLTIISDAGRRGERGQAVYGAAKAAAAGFTRGLAMEVGRAGVTVNCIALGSVPHGATADAMGADPDRAKAMARPYPAGRVGRVEDPAPLAVLLCSDAAKWITGQVYPVDGGYAPAL